MNEWLDDVNFLSRKTFKYKGSCFVGWQNDKFSCKSMWIFNACIFNFEWLCQNLTRFTWCKDLSSVCSVFKLGLGLNSWNFWLLWCHLQVLTPGLSPLNCRHLMSVSNISTKFSKYLILKQLEFYNPSKRYL